MHSSLYVGQVRHRRFAPREHQFSYRLFMVYLDLDELPTVFQRFWLWSLEKRNIATFRRRDHLKPETTDLKTAVCDLVEEHRGKRPNGPVRLLTNLAYFGFRFNPVSFYYCFDKTGETLEYIVAEVNNTPWGEQFCYVMDAAENLNQDDKQPQRHTARKQFHVSPFMEMEMDYDWRMSKPGKTLNVHMENHQAGEKLFDATMQLKHRPINQRELAAVLVRHPFMTGKIVAAIYFEALRLWLKRIPFITHPGTSTRPESTPETTHSTNNSPEIAVNSELSAAFSHPKEAKTL
ncbi:MAG: DUF1365 domain-containing protein [Thiolinea sp.]